ncbi:STAS domain-containing protein [Sphaerisporangium sp. NPDC005289]|uniref:STAS domain-containing protein n=1 Tax=Sphaerisporangium sp. NPDC005289 TaxID=3155247 RepID=UPI0033B9CA81
MQFGADPQAGLVVFSRGGNSAIVVEAQGELDYRSAVILRDELGRAWSMPGVTAVILDVAGVTFCDSVGLSELIAALHHSQAAGQGFMLSGVQGTLLRVLTITGLRAAFDTYESVDDAMLRVSPSGGGATETLDPLGLAGATGPHLGGAVPMDTIGPGQADDVLTSVSGAGQGDDASTVAGVLQQADDLPPPDSASPIPPPQT